MTKMDPVGKLLADAWSLFKQRGAVLIQIFIIPAVLVAMVQLLALRNTPQAWALVPVINLVVIVVAIVASIALLSAIGRGTDFEASYKVGFSLFWSAIFLTLIHTLTLFGGAALLVIPGIVFSIWFMFANYTLVLEGKRGIAAMLQSKAYVKGYWWAVLGRMLILGIIVMCVIIIIYAPAVALLGRMIGAVIYGALMLVVAPFAICYSYKVYDNLVRLKPNINELAAKETKALVITFIVIGIVAILVIFALMGVLIGFLIKNAVEHGQVQLPPGYLSPNGFPNQYAAPTGTYPAGIPTPPPAGPGPNIY